MTPAERLQRYLERQLELLASYGELQGKIEESVRAGRVDLLAVQALEARRLADECSELQRAARPLARAGGGGSSGLEARLAAGRESALAAGRRSRAALSDSLQELAARIRELQARPRTPPSPFTRIGRPVLVDLRS
jgi:hypothetical protein